MKKEARTIVYDKTLRLEAYRLTGIARPFPEHFHDHYVFGLMEDGSRSLSCDGRDYIITKGDMIIFHPYDNHACTQKGRNLLDYRGLNIPESVMLDLSEDMTGERKLPRFSKHIMSDAQIIRSFRLLHEMIMDQEKDFVKEEKFLTVLSALFEKHEPNFYKNIPACREEVEKACRFMEENFSEHISLEEISRYAGLSKSTLLRAFAKEKGITPYRYLETIRIHQAKQMLGEGMAPAEVAIKTGFSDQSHFTNYFSRLIGVAPGAYRQIFYRRKEGK